MAMLFKIKKVFSKNTMYEEITKQFIICEDPVILNQFFERDRYFDLISSEILDRDIKQILT
tara:strand:+ start:2875 stop:3057 length:183 start_codon:yes stop_codon:yes gene_type:complete